MAVLKNKTQKNFTMISNNILRDKSLSMKDCGVLCTLCSLPDGWEFSIVGLSATVPDGVDSIRKSITNLEELGYMNRTKSRGSDGKYISEIEVFTERNEREEPCGIIRHGKPVTEKPLRVNHHGKTVTDNPTEYNTDNIKQSINTGDVKSIYQSCEIAAEVDGENEISAYRELVSENIHLDWLYEVARRHSEDEVSMVMEIYEVICDMVCFPREAVVIRETKYPWNVVKSKFLKLRYEHICSVLDRIVDADLHIKNMQSYLVSTLFTQAAVGTLEAQANLHDDYLKMLRGKPYEY